MEISEAAMSVFHLCRWTGFAPFAIIRNRNRHNDIVDLKPDLISFVIGIIRFVLSTVFANEVFSNEYTFSSDVIR